MRTKRRHDEYKAGALKTVYESGGMSRAGLGRALDVRPDTITEVVKELIEEGLIREKGKVRNARGVGKNETLLSVNPAGKYFLGCGLTPGKVGVRILDLEGATVSGIARPLNETDKFDILDRITGEVASEVKRQGIPPGKIYGLGFVDPGIIDVEKGYSVSSTIMPEWKNVPTRDYLSGKLGVSVFMIGTSQARALAECLFGSGKNVSNFMYIEYSRGIACGMVSEGKLVRGRNELAGELGHFRFEGRPELCRCGRFGCLEAIASQPAVERKAREALGSGPAASPGKCEPEESPARALESLARSARAGCRSAVKIVDEVNEYISVAVASLIHVMDPSKVIFDRSFLMYGEEFVDVMFDRIEREIIFPGKIEFEISRLDYSEGALGGAGLALHEFLRLGITRI